MKNCLEKEKIYLIKQLEQKFNCDEIELFKKLENLLENFETIDNGDLIIDNITWSYKKTKLLKNINIKIKPGCFHVFIGENGAGKSTTIKCIVGIIDNYIGKIYFEKLGKIDRNFISYVPDQQPKFPTNMTVYEYLFNTTKILTNIGNELIDEKIKHYLKKYNLTNLTKRNVNKLSTGQKQKILLISSFLLNKKIIILDEPFANLDPTSRYKFMNELKEMSNNGISIFLSSHILDEIKEYADYATFIKNGRIILSSTIDNKEFITNFYKEKYIFEGDDDEN